MQVIYLVRHASPDWNNQQLPYYLPPGPPLSTQGLQEAEQLGEYLGSSGIGRLITSPFERCLRTAQVVSGITGVQVEVAPGLGEVQPDETEENLRLRVGKVLEDALGVDEHPESIALVTHGSPVASLLSLLGMPDDDLSRHRTFGQGNPVPPAGAWRAVREGNNPAWELNLGFVPESRSQT